MRITPLLGTKGKFNVKLPFTTHPAKLYEVIAIRSFDDVYKAGRDVYEDLYKKMGLIDGTATPDGVFDFATEKAKGPNIISLRDPSGEVLYVPDTFITTYPETKEVPYDHVVLSMSLGAIPQTLDLSSLMDDVKDFIQSRTGVGAEMQLHIAPSETNPTAEQHLALEAARSALVTNNTSNALKVTQQAALLDAAQVQRETLARVLQQNETP